MKIILCGYHWTGCDALRQLLNANHEVFVYTHEAPNFIPSLSSYCEKTQTSYSLENISRSKLPFKPDVIASIYYRHMIKKPVIDACERRIFNLHPSLLPRYRGCSSLTWAMINGEAQAGFSYHFVDEGCDTGNIIIQQAIDIEDFDSQATLYQRVGFMAMSRFSEVLELVLSGTTGRVQVGTPSYYRRGCPHDGKIDMTWPTDMIERFIRAMDYPPYPSATLNGRPVRSLSEFREQMFEQVSREAA
ncbi:MAG: hypothetical protein KDB03_10065 [Planctomycetales bacterium]|nr:hypothetical protein [Planctomycetales bacterium]